MCHLFIQPIDCRFESIFIWICVNYNFTKCFGMYVYSQRPEVWENLFSKTKNVSANCNISLFNKSAFTIFVKYHRMTS